MSLAEACGWTLLRSLIVAACAVPLCFAIRRRLLTARGRRRTLLWGTVLTPFFAPDMLVGYGYYNFSLSLIHHPLLNELFYAALVFFKVLPVGTVIAVCTPHPPISPQALYCRRLAITADASPWKRFRELAGYYVRGPYRAALPAAVLMFLLAFQEFELVSLVNATSWTVWLFDQQAQGLPINTTLRYDLIPTGIQAAIVIAMIPLILKSRRAAGNRDAPRGAVSPVVGPLLWCLLVTGCTLLWFIPVGILSSGMADGLVVLRRNPRLFKEIAVGLGMTLAAAVPAYGFAALLLPAALSRPGQKLRAAVAILAGLPGLFGGLTLGLTTLSLFQTEALYRWYDTPLPWWGALVLWLLPRAMLLQVLLAAARRREPIHLAELLQRSGSPPQRRRARPVLWRLRYQGHYWAVVLLCWWSYLDPTLPSLLRPSGLDPAPMRIYNFMHYGQAGGLSAMLALTVLVPVLLAAALLPAARFVAPLYDRLIARSR